MKPKKLTDKFVRALPKHPAPEGKRVIHWDTEVKNFGVRVTDTGHVSFVVQARWGGEKYSTRRRIDVATLAAARAIARDWLDEAGTGEDPRKIQEQKDAERAAAEAAEKLRRENTFEKVATEWFQFIKAQRKAPEVERDVRRIFLQRWADRPVMEITTADVDEVINSMKGTPAQARNALGYAQRLFRWASKQPRFGLAESPAAKLEARDYVGRKRRGNRVLTDDELRLLWRAVGRLRTERKRTKDDSSIYFPGDYPHGPLFRLLILTGQRKSEVAKARWREFDLHKRLWTIPAERMKSDRAHVVPLTDEMVALLQALPRSTSKRSDHDCLFSTTNGAKPVNSFGKVKARIDRRMLSALRALARRRGEDTAAVTLPRWTIHDLRRTVRTNLSALPIPYQVCELMIAHAMSELGATYDLHSYEKEKRRGFDLWGSRLHHILQRSPPDNVVSLHDGLVNPILMEFGR
ncbi:MAG: site-specific integrase [Xanthobacteraceae bacterium]|nr:site-specific integrase [Xanthobacteraceae bacterium]